jgi:hypothetical protein
MMSNDELAAQLVPVKVAELFDIRCFSVFRAGIRQYRVETALTLLKMELQQHEPGVHLICFQNPGLGRLLMARFMKLHPEVTADFFTTTQRKLK